jgi:hypothetical protein
MSKLLYNVDFSSVSSLDPVNVDTISLSYLNNNKFIISGLGTMQPIFLNTEYFMGVLQKSIDTVNNDGDVKELKNFIYDNMNNMECIDFPSPLKNITHHKTFTVSKIHVEYKHGPKSFTNNIPNLESININMIKVDSKGKHKFTLCINIYNNGNMAISIIPGDLYNGDNIVIGLDAVEFLHMIQAAVDNIECKDGYEFNNLMENFKNVLSPHITSKRPPAYINKQCTASLKPGEEV